MSFNIRKASDNSLQGSQTKSLKSSQLKSSQQQISSSQQINPFKQAVKRNPFLKPLNTNNNSSQVTNTTGNDNDDYEGEGDLNPSTKRNTKMKEIISIDRFNGKVIKKWVPIIEEDTREFRRSTLNELERTNRQSVFNRGKSIIDKSGLIGTGESLYGTQSPLRNTQESLQTNKKRDNYSQNTNKPDNNNFLSPERFQQQQIENKSSQEIYQNSSQLRHSVNIRRANINEFQSPNQDYNNNSPNRYEIGSDNNNNKYNTTKLQNFESPAKRYKRPHQETTQYSSKRSSGFDTQSPLEFPKPDPSQSHIKEYLIEWINAENLTQPTSDFLKNQPNLTHWMRSELINWIPKLYSKLNFGKGQNYYLIVRLIDRSLGIKQFPKAELKSLVLTSIWFINHYYDSSPLTLSQFIDILNLPNEYYLKIQSLTIWLYQNFFETLLNCNPNLFLRKLSIELGIQDLYVLNVSKYLIEYSVLDYKLSQVRPSLLASGALLIVKYLLSSRFSQVQIDNFVKLTGYKLRHLIQVGIFMIDYTMTHPNFHYINEKFNLDNCQNFQNFSKFVRIELVNCRPSLIELIGNGYNFSGIGIEGSGEGIVSIGGGNIGN